MLVSVNTATAGGGRARIHENARIFDFALSADDMAELDTLDQPGSTDRALEVTWW